MYTTVLIGQILLNEIILHKFASTDYRGRILGRNWDKITINVPLFKKLRDIIFFCGTITF